MTKKIFRSTFFTSILVLISCFILVLGILYGFFEKQLENELASEANYIAYAIEDKGDAFFDNFASSNKRITLISPTGEVIADTMADPKNMDNHSDRAEFQKAEDTGSGTSVRYSNTLTEKNRILCNQAFQRQYPAHIHDTVHYSDNHSRAYATHYNCPDARADSLAFSCVKSFKKRFKANQFNRSR